MDQEIKVSVIMPIFNAAEYLHPALDSVLDQTLKEIEIICVDDGSVDASLSLLKEYQKLDRRIRIVTENNAGPAIARNNGLHRARGEYVIFLDADDFFDPRLLETLYTMAQRDRLDIALCSYDVYHAREAKFTPRIAGEAEASFPPDTVMSKSSLPNEIFQVTDAHTWDKLFLRSFLTEKNLTFPADVRVFEDLFFVTLALSLAERIERTESTLIHHRVYSQSARPRMLRKYYAKVPLLFADLKKNLTRTGLYLPLSTSFANLSADRCYKVYNLLWFDAKPVFWKMLHERYAEEIGWHDCTASMIRDPAAFEFMANVSMYTYEQYLRRESKGLKIKLKQYVRRYLTKREGSFLSRIFRRKT